LEFNVPFQHKYGYIRDDVTWGNGSGCPLVVHYWADLQSVHGFRCYDNIVPNAKCQRVLVLAVCLVKRVIMLLTVNLSNVFTLTMRLCSEFVMKSSVQTVRQ